MTHLLGARSGVTDVEVIIVLDPTRAAAATVGRGACGPTPGETG